MSTREDDDQDTAVEQTEDTAAEQTEEKHKLELQVEITNSGPCKKHLKVAIAQGEIERQFDDSLGSMKREAQVPGFRPGHAPRHLVQKRFRKEVEGKVKTTLLLAALEQLDEDYKINPISQPNLDIEAIELPEDGPLQFEMEVEVEPDFELPAYKALTVKRPVKEISDKDVEVQLKQFRERYAQLVPKLEGGAEMGDQITANLTFTKDGTTLNEAREVTFRLQPQLRFQDGHVPDLGKALLGVRPDEQRNAEALIGSGSNDPNLRGQTIEVVFDVLDLKTLRLPELDREFLESVGFDSQEELSSALRELLERRVGYLQRQALRKAILDQLVEQTPFDLPSDLVARQEVSTLRSQLHEMREAGMSESEIRARQAEIRANAHEATLRNLKEFFILSKIAETEGVKVEDEDIAYEIEAIADRSDESPRRVRSRIEKEGLLDGLASQILERKTIDRILEFVKVEEVPFVDEQTAETLDQTASGVEPEEETEAGAGEAAGTEAEGGETA